MVSSGSVVKMPSSSSSSSTHVNTGQMDTKPVRCLINSISRFIHLVSCQTLKLMPTQKDYINMTSSLKLMKQVFDEVADCKLPSDENLIKECEELDLSVNEAREFMENWSPKISKICCVLQSEPMLIKIQTTSIKICHIISRLLLSSSSTSSSTVVQSCMQELQCLKLERISDLIEETLKSQTSCAENLKKIINSLNLTTSQELLKEHMAVEKDRMKIGAHNPKREIDEVNQAVKLLSNIRDYMVKLDCFNFYNNVSIPLYFRCPLSFNLMLDPVIVASGQTYERASIQKWLDNGLATCPKTLQILSHTNLIPNYTVKALIANWCEDNKISLSEAFERTNIVLDHVVSSQDLIRVDSFGGSLPSSGCASRSSIEVGNGFDPQKLDNSFGSSEEGSNIKEAGPNQSYNHSRSESASSVVSSIGHTPPLLNEEIQISNNTLENPSGFSPLLAGKQFCSTKTRATEINSCRNGSCVDYPRALSLPSPNSGTDNLTTISHVEKLIEDLKSQSEEVQTTAAAELRLLAKHNTENRAMIGHCGAIPPLVSLLSSEVKLTQEHAVTALLNLSINENNKAIIAEMGPIEPLINILKSGNPCAKENSAATLFSLSVLDEYKAKIGRSGAVKALVDLLGSGTLRGKKDAATALFNLSIFHENKARIVKAGAVKHLVSFMDPESTMVNKAVALLANLSSIVEGRLAIVREGGIPLLVEVVETGSSVGKENAATILLQLCIDSTKFCTLVLQEGAVPPLVALSQSGTPRAKEKAQQLLSHFRSQREAATKKGKS